MMKKLLVRAGLIVMIMSLCFAGSAFAATESEPNNSHTQANTVVNVHFTQMGEVMYGTLAEGGDIDFYTFNAPVSGLQHVLVAPPSGETLSYAIYDAALYTPGSSAGWILSRANVSSFDDTTFISQAGHSYYIFIFGQGSGSNQYTLWLYYE